jgi:hypothetical protein
MFFARYNKWLENAILADGIRQIIELQGIKFPSRLIGIWFYFVQLNPIY